MFSLQKITNMLPLRSLRRPLMTLTQKARTQGPNLPRLDGGSNLFGAVGLTKHRRKPFLAGKLLFGFDHRISL